MVIMAICAVVFALSIFRTGMGILDSLMFAVALAVAAIPEALSSIVTIVLAMGTEDGPPERYYEGSQGGGEPGLRLRHLLGQDGHPDPEQDDPSEGVRRRLPAGGRDLSLVNDVQRLLLKAALLASDATNNEKEGTAIGDPTEVALVMLGEKFGVDEESYRAQHPVWASWPLTPTAS